MDIKKIILALTVAVSATYAFAQEKAGDSKPAEYEFTVIKEAPVTSIKTSTVQVPAGVSPLFHSSSQR